MNREKLIRSIVFIAAVIISAGCGRNADRNRSSIYRTLHDAGVGDRTIESLVAFNITSPELEQVVVMRNAGTADPTIVRLFALDRRREPQFTIGEDVARLRNAGASDLSIIDLASLGALPVWTNDVVAMRAAGISDQTIERLAAMKFDEHKFVLDGVTIAAIKQTGYSDSGIITLIERGVTHRQAQSAIALRGEGTSESEIFRRLFP